jgi:hypothetical protein
MTRLAGILSCLALAGCSTAPTGNEKAVDVGAEVTIAPGSTISLKDAQLAARFVAVSDSRCPRDTTCVWAGEVKVLLEFRTPQGTSQAEILEGDNAAAGGYRVTLVRVEPQPVSTAKIAPQDYRATLRIDSSP